MFEKGPYKKYMLFRKFIRLTKHMFFEKVYMFLKKVYMFFEKVCMFFKNYICFLKKYVCFLKKYIFFEKAYIFFVRLLLVHRTGDGYRAGVEQVYGLAYFSLTIFLALTSRTSALFF